MLVFSQSSTTLRLETPRGGRTNPPPLSDRRWRNTVSGRGLRLPTFSLSILCNASKIAKLKRFSLLFLSLPWFTPRPRRPRLLQFLSLDGTRLKRLQLCCAAWLEASMSRALLLDGTSVKRLQLCCAVHIESFIYLRSGQASLSSMESSIWLGSSLASGCNTKHSAALRRPPKLKKYVRIDVGLTIGPWI